MPMPAPAADGDSSSEEPWAKARRARTPPPKKTRAPPSAKAQFAQAVAALARASASLAFQHPRAESAGQGKGKRAFAEESGDESKSEAGESRARRRARACKYSQGTFQGRRPPKNPAKLKLFLARKEVHDAQLAESRSAARVVAAVAKQPSARQQAYREFMSNAMTGDNSRERFAVAAAEWRSKRQSSEKGAEAPVAGQAPVNTEAEAPAAQTPVKQAPRERELAMTATPEKSEQPEPPKNKRQVKLSDMFAK